MEQVYFEFSSTVVNSWNSKYSIELEKKKTVEYYNYLFYQVGSDYAAGFKHGLIDWIGSVL